MSRSRTRASASPPSEPGERCPATGPPGPTWTGAHGSPRATSAATCCASWSSPAPPGCRCCASIAAHLDPLHFAIYGDVVYHHGAGFRSGELSPAHREHAPRARPSAASAPRARRAHRLAEACAGGAGNARSGRACCAESERVYAQIERGGEDWLAELAALGGSPARSPAGACSDAGVPSTSPVNSSLAAASVSVAARHLTRYTCVPVPRNGTCSMAVARAGADVPLADRVEADPVRVLALAGRRPRRAARA